MALENGTRRECRPNLLKFSVNSTNSLTMAERNVLLIVLAELPGKMDFWIWRGVWDEFHNWLVSEADSGCVLSTLGHGKCRFANARPEPDFKYRSNSNALCSVLNSIDTTTLQGRSRAVSVFWPALCHRSR